MKQTHHESNDPGHRGLPAGMLTFLEVAHMVDATALIVWGGVGMLTFLEVAHIVDATALIGWGGVGWEC